MLREFFTPDVEGIESACAVLEEALLIVPYGVYIDTRQQR